MFLLFSLSVSSHLLCRRYNRTRLQEPWLFRVGQQKQATGVLVVHMGPGLANRPDYRNFCCSGLANRIRLQEFWLFWLFLIGQQDQATGILVVPGWPTEAGHRNPGCPGLANRPGHRNPRCSGLANRSRPQEFWLSRIGEQDQATGILVVPDWRTGPDHRNPGCSGLDNLSVVPGAYAPSSGTSWSRFNEHGSNYASGKPSDPLRGYIVMCTIQI